MSGNFPTGRTCQVVRGGIGSMFPSRSGWKVRYVKEVDANEVTLRFYQEIYDEIGDFIEVHHKYPVNLGHRKV